MESNNNNVKETHNKSGLLCLSLLEFSDEQLFASYSKMKKDLELEANLVSDRFERPCSVLKNASGRWNDSKLKIGSQVCYGYQLTAFVVYGRGILEQVRANKKSAEHWTISHLCTVEYCCSPYHTLLERKRINDERTHCQYSIKNILKAGGGYDDIVSFWKLNACNHNPHCGDVRRVFFIDQ